MADKKQRRVVSLLPKIVESGTYPTIQQSPEVVAEIVRELDKVLDRYVDRLPVCELLVALRLCAKILMESCLRQYGRKMTDVILRDAEDIEKNYESEHPDDPA